MLICHWLHEGLGAHLLSLSVLNWLQVAGEAVEKEAVAEEAVAGEAVAEEAVVEHGIRTPNGGIHPKSLR